MNSLLALIHFKYNLYRKGHWSFSKSLSILLTVLESSEELNSDEHTECTGTLGMPDLRGNLELSTNLRLVSV